MKKSTSYIICIFGFTCLLLTVYFASYAYSIRNMKSDNIVTAKAEEAKTVEKEMNQKKIITLHTKFILQDYNMTKDTIKEYQYLPPLELVGMKKEELLNYLNQYMKQMSDSERKILEYKLVSFEADKVVIRKSYQTYEDIEYPFYIKEVAGKIVVYEADQKSIYLRTNIDVEQIPKEEKDEIKKGKCIKSNQELFYCLESYTS